MSFVFILFMIVSVLHRSVTLSWGARQLGNIPSWGIAATGSVTNHSSFRRRFIELSSCSSLLADRGGRLSLSNGTAYSRLSLKCLPSALPAAQVTLGNG